MRKIRLLNSGGYSTNGKIDFPVIVDGYAGRGLCAVRADQLAAIGFTSMGGKSWIFEIGSECEVIEEAE
tara:strand:- start:240 stop:446 length:207 start_codon:yes stop_codon:yes gene_type:complete